MRRTDPRRRPIPAPTIRARDSSATSANGAARRRPAAAPSAVAVNSTAMTPTPRRQRRPRRSRPGRQGRWRKMRRRKSDRRRPRRKSDPKSAQKGDVPNMKKSFEVRFWSKVQRGKSNECWPWMGSRSPLGYGHITQRRKHLWAHRVAYELSVGPIPDGHCVCHKCDNPSCCNPAHLFKGTPADNIRDAASKGRMAKGQELPGAKLTDALVVLIKKQIAGGTPLKTLASRYGVSAGTISRIKTRHTWRHIDQPECKSDRRKRTA